MRTDTEKKIKRNINERTWRFGVILPLSNALSDTYRKSLTHSLASSFHIHHRRRLLYFFFHVNPPRKHPQNSRGIIFRETRNMEQGIYKHGGWTLSSVYFLLLTTWSYLLEEVLNELKSKVIMYSNHIPVNTSITVMNEVIER